MSLILAIDPGTTHSAKVLYDPNSRCVIIHGKHANDELVCTLRIQATNADWRVVIEGIASYGRPVGAEVFQTAIWIGRFIEAWDANRNGQSEAVLIYRRQVKRHLCGSELKVNDAVIRQRLIDLFGPGKAVAIGTKKTPGPLYGLRADEWSALALAVTFSEQGTKEEIHE